MKRLICMLLLALSMTAGVCHATEISQSAGLNIFNRTEDSCRLGGNKKTEVTTEVAPKFDFENSNTSVWPLVGAGVVALGCGAAYQIHQVKKSLTPVH